MPQIIVDPAHRYTFPAPGQDIVFRPPSRQGSSLTSARGAIFAVWEDEDLSIPADIQLMDGTEYPDPQVTVGDGSRLPRWLGPLGAIHLWLTNPSFATIQVQAADLEVGGAIPPTPPPVDIIDGGGPEDTVPPGTIDGGTP